MRAAEDLVAFAQKRVEAVKAEKGRTARAVYRRFFPAAEVFRDKGFSIPRMVEEFVEGGHWEESKSDALRQAIARHFRKMERGRDRESGRPGDGE